MDDEKADNGKGRNRPDFGIKSNVIQLRNKLNSLSSRKEELFRKKEEIKKDVLKLIKDLKESRENRDRLTDEVKKLKERRIELSSKIDEEIEKIKKINSEKRELLKKHEIKRNPSDILKDIERLEFRFETEAMNIEKEKKMMDTIRKLKGDYKKSESISYIFEESNKVDRKINELKKEAKVVYNEVQKKAKLSQDFHEAIVANSPKIDELKEKELTLTVEISKIREEIKKAEGELDKALGDMAEKSRAIDEKKKKEYMETIGKKILAVEEKLRKGQKLTTDDIIAFQGKK